jgi:hypothetical protein
MKILLRDFSAKAVRGDIFGPRTGNESFHEACNDNGIDILNLVISKYVVFRNKMFPHLRIHEYTSTTTDGSTD